MDAPVRVRLRDVCKLENGFAFDGSKFSRVKGTPLIRIRDLKTNTPSELFDGEYAPEYLVNAGDLLVGMDGEFRCYRWRGPQALLNQRLCRLEPDPAHLDVDYLALILNAYLKRIENETSFTTVKHISSKQILDIEVPLLPLDAQRRTAKMLDRKMALAERASAFAREQKGLIDDFVSATLREAFHSIVPLSIDPNEAERAPRNWRWARLTDIARLESGHTPSRKHPEWWGGDIPWLALPDIRALHGTMAMTTTERTNEAGIANSSARVLPKDTVVLSRTASVGFVAIMGRPMATSQDFVNWVCGPELEPWFLVYLLMASRNRLLSLSSGAIHKTIYMPTVEAFHVCVPSIETQRIIVKKIRERLIFNERMRQRAAEKGDAIAAMPQAILRQVFGEAA